MGLHVGPHRIGQINAGATADLSFFDIQTDTDSPQGIEETLHNFVRHGAGSAKATVISGNLAYNDGAFAKQRLQSSAYATILTKYRLPNTYPAKQQNTSQIK